jgi:hypothetical protein
MIGQMSTPGATPTPRRGFRVTISTAAVRCPMMKVIPSLTGPGGDSVAEGGFNLMVGLDQVATGENQRGHPWQR